jgi:propanol-preferring alcohol dehydrogenase
MARCWTEDRVDGDRRRSGYRRSDCSNREQSLDEGLPGRFNHEGRVRAHVHAARLDDINRVLSDLRAGNVEGRIVLDVA